MTWLDSAMLVDHGFSKERITDKMINAHSSLTKDVKFISEITGKL